MRNFFIGLLLGLTVAFLIERRNDVMVQGMDNFKDGMVTCKGVYNGVPPLWTR